MRRIAIDIVTHTPGKGGSGGGIWTVTKNFLLSLDNELPGNNQLHIYCFANRSFDVKLTNIKIIRIKFGTGNIVSRLIYVHLVLPLYCLFYKINIIQKLATEVPFFCVSKRAVFIQDFMPEYYLENSFQKLESALQKLKLRYFLFITRRALSKSKIIITSSGSVKEEAVARYDVKPEKIHVCNYGVTIPPENVKKKKDSNTIRLSCIAAFFPHKGHFRLIDVFERMLTKYNLDIELFFRGNVSDHRFYESVVKRIGTSPYKDKIHIIPYSAAATLTDIYLQTDIMILLSEYEGFGFPVLEAQAFGVPVICSDIKVFNEIAGNAALFFDLANINTSIDEIVLLLNDSNRLDNLRKEGKINSEKYTWQSFGKKMLNIYQQSAI